MKKHLLTFFACCLSLVATAQQEAYNWHFGELVSMNFSMGVPQPQPITSSEIMAGAGCASISDSTGNLLFYTNGSRVWDAYNVPMPNGTGLHANTDHAQAALIVPKPASPEKYYIFTVKQSSPSNDGGLKYSEVDMTLNNNRGDVIISSKNMLLFRETNTQLAATYHFNNQDVWVMALDKENKNFRAYRVTANGVTHTPVISGNFSPLHTYELNDGQMKFSANGRKLGVSAGESGVFLFDFDPATGMVSNRRFIRGDIGDTFYGLEFSQDASRLYFTSNNWELYQANLLSPNIAATVELIAMTRGASSLQIAPDNKIYLSKANTDTLGVINYPSLSGKACDFQASLKVTTGWGLRKGLPNFISNYFAPPAFAFTDPCANQAVTFFLSDSTGADSAHWNFSDTLNTSNFASGFSPTHNFSSSGLYAVRVTVYINGSSATYKQNVLITAPPRVDITSTDSVYCEGKEVRLRNFYPPNTHMETYFWSNSFNSKTATDPSIVIKETGWYYLEVSNGNCSATDSVFIRFQEPPTVNLGKNKTFCGSIDEPIQLNATTTEPGATYLWQDGSTDPVYWVTKPGTYEVIITVGPCEVKESITISTTNYPNLDLGPNREVCDENPVVLQTASNFTLWSTGDTSRTLTVTETGWYSATIFSLNRACSVTDSVYIEFKSCVLASNIPNIITPNHDELNENFYIKNLMPGEWQLEIYNRWGMRVYFSSDYRNDWSGEGLTDGTYYYHLRSQINDQAFKGWVEIKR